MPLSQRDLRVMVAAASSIPERLSGHVVFEDGQESREECQARLYAWCQASGGDWPDFEQRLGWDGLDLAGAKRLLTPGIWSDEAVLPAWTATLQEALKVLEALPGESIIAEKSSWAFLDAQTPLPFEELLASFVLVAWRRFIEQAGSAVRLLADGAHMNLQRHLLQTLTSLAVPLLHAEFAQHRAWAQATEKNTQSGHLDLYQHFLRRMCQGGLAALLRTYCVLARLLATTCDHWVEAVLEFVQRLTTDWSALEQMAGSGSKLGQVKEIQPALSDAHVGRRCVMVLNFACGSKLIYKPRSVGMEEAYSRLLLWCNAHGAVPPFKVLTILPRAAYGWVEFVEQEPCQDGEALLRYYQRAGMQLCLIYLLGGRNCFYDQWIAHGEQPMLVDASNLLQPYFRPDPQRQQGEGWEQALYSVLHTGMLTSWHLPTTGAAASPQGARSFASDISGLGARREHRRAMPGVRQKEHSQMPLMLKYGSLRPRAPLHTATSADPSGHPQEEELHKALCQGFERMYQLVLQWRAELLAPESPFQYFKTQLVRITYRNRASYDDLFPLLLAPQALQDALTRSMLFDRLGFDCVPIDWFQAEKRDQAHWWAIFAAERQALLQSEIPLVSARADHDALIIAPDQEVASCLYQPGFDLLLTRLEHLSEENMRQQRALLEQALPQKITPMVMSPESAVQHDMASDLSGVDTFMIQALAIADDLARHAVKIGEDSVTWITTAGSHRFQYYRLQPMRYGFCNGVGGIAFFLAALAKRSAIPSYGWLARAAVLPLRRLVREEGEQLACEMGLGAGLGLGSIVYALTRISQFLDDPNLLVDARSAARLITPERIADDVFLDVFMGSAGALLGLLALYEVAPEQELLDQAMGCGEHLLRTRTPSTANCLAWPTLNGRRHTTGFAHGAAGIVYALLRLYALTGDAALLEAAQEGLRYEDHAFVHEQGNWVEEVGTGKAVFGISWCHGAPGIGLARLGSLSLLDTPSIRRDIEVALQTTQDIGAVGHDHLCCGTCGRVELLLTAARRLDRPKIAEVAAHWIRQVLTRAEQRGGFVLNPLLPRWVVHHQLFQGTAGIGYTLLRLAQPDALPSLLLWE